MFTSSNKGVSLFAIVVMIGVLGISLTVTHLLLHKQTNATRESETRKEVKEIYEAIMGNSEMGTFGYVGDMGRLPNNLTELVEKANQPDYAEPEDPKGIKYGWNGPYINGGRDLESYKKDAWGNDYAIVGGQIHSKGTDGMADSADDIVFPPKPLNSFNGFLVLKAPKGGILCEISDIKEIIVYYGEEGVEKSKSLETEDFKLSDTEGFYTTDPIPLHSGIHAVKVSDVIGKTVFANVAVSAESTEAQVVGTLPYKGINLHPQSPPHISPDDNRTVEVNIVNATGCTEGFSYNVSQMDIAIVGNGEQQYLSGIRFDDSVIFTANPSILVSSDLENPTRISPVEIILEPGLSRNKLVFQDAPVSGIYQLTYHYTDTEEPGALKNSRISFRLK